MNSISGINVSQIAPQQLPRTEGIASGGPSFKNLLLESIDKVNSMQIEADRAVEGLFTGDDVNPAEVMTAVQKADLAFKMMMQTRNKLMQAYQEIKDIRI
jgi:flagellar hook-basal body complex protein FliE